MKNWSWLTDTAHRIYPADSVTRTNGLTLPAARGECLSAQVAVRVADVHLPQVVEFRCRAPKGISVRVRRVGFVPVPHHNTPRDLPAKHREGCLPGYVPDPLFDESKQTLWPGETGLFWLTIYVSRSCRPGVKKIRIEVDFVNWEVQRHELAVHVADVTLQPRKNFPVTHWFYADALLDWYKLDAFEPAFWEMAEKYIRNMVAHGQDTLYVPVFTPPLDGVKRPTQLCRVQRTGRDRYDLDFRDVRKYVRLAKKCGIKNFEFNHPFTQWGVEYAIRIYHGQGQDEKLLWKPETSATGPTYRKFLSQYLPKLHDFCKRESILNRSFFHLSDEPHEKHLTNYRKARKLLAELAPWMTVMDALSHADYARDGLVDMPIPSIKTTREFTKDPADAKSPRCWDVPRIPSWTYFCCGPRGEYLNRLMDTPLSKLRMAGWLFYRTGVLGFLHWGYNYWYASQTRNLINPFAVSDGGKAPGWAYGDTFVVYPGPDGPLDSIRWEIFAESLQDYALLQTLDVDRGGKLLVGLKDYNDFPFSPQWAVTARRKLLLGH